jgi:hypothetical protein
VRRLVLALLLVTSLVTSLGGCGWVGRADETSKPDGFLLHGYVSVAGAATGVAGTPCLAPSSAPDIVSGATVRAADADGHVIALTSLAGGVLAEASDGFHCNFAFELRNLSGSRPTYQILVADRPGTSFETRQLREGKPAVVPVAAATASSSPS